MKKLSILIPSLTSRYDLLYSLLAKLKRQSNGYIEVLTATDEGQMTIGEKRNKLLEEAKGEYVAFIDDDDMISDNYIKLLMQGIETNPDCISLKGEYSVDGVFDGIFEHSLKYDKWATVSGKEVKYERYPNHLNCIKASIAKQFKFPEINHGEDWAWSNRLHESKLLNKEYYINDILYYYKYKTNK